MSLYYCGFNGFGQLPTAKCNIVEVFTLYPIENVEGASLSWSNVVVHTRGSDVYISGLVNEEQNVMKKLKFDEMPSKASGSSRSAEPKLKIVQVSSSPQSERILFLAQTGDCWISIANESIKKLPYFVNTEKSTAEETCIDQIIKISCGNIGNFALSLRGHVYSIPSLIHLSRIKVTDIACGFEHNILLTNTGSVYSWGQGSRGQLGNGTLEDEESPVMLVTLSDVVSISAGGWHSAVATSSGVMWTWGWNNEGQLGFPSPKAAGDTDDVVNIAAEPMEVKLNVRAKQVACGNRHTVMLSDENSVWGCGWNISGQLGRSKSSAANLFRMTKLTVPPGTIDKVLAGSWSTAVLIL